MKKKKNKTNRGKTFINFVPKREDNIIVKKRRKERKHRKKIYEEV